MSNFKYQAFDFSGKSNKGYIEAQNYQLALEKLKSRDLTVYKLSMYNGSLLMREINLFEPKVSTEHFTVFCRQLATMYKSGMAMLESINILSEQTESKAFRKILCDVAEQMRTGTQLSVAATNHPSVFSSIFIHMVRAGEVSGNLDDMLNRLAEFNEKSHNTKEKVKSAMIYPIIMGIVSALIVIFMMKFIIPKYVSNFESMGVQLPLITRIIMELSNFVQNYWYIVIILLLFPSISSYLIKKFVPHGQYYLDWIKLKTPVFGKLWHKQALARFSRTLSSLLTAAIPMLQIMSIVSKVVGNEVIGKVIMDSREGIRRGESMAQPFAQSWLFPPMVVQMLSVGEQSGELDSMMEKVADFYEAEVDSMADRLKTLLEPIMILTLAVIIGGIVLAVLMPTFKMMENI